MATKYKYAAGILNREDDYNKLSKRTSSLSILSRGRKNYLQEKKIHVQKMKIFSQIDKILMKSAGKK